MCRCNYVPFSDAKMPGDKDKEAVGFIMKRLISGS